MIFEVECEKCGVRYRVNDERIPAGGTWRCLRCESLQNIKTAARLPFTPIRRHFSAPATSDFGPGMVQWATDEEIAALPETLNRKKTERLMFLRALYIATDGRTTVADSARSVFERVRLDPIACDPILEFLQEEGLLVVDAEFVRLTHQGVMEIEAATESPNKDTKHFPSLVIQHVFNQPVGAVSFGADSVSNVEQIVSSSPPAATMHSRTGFISTDSGLNIKQSHGGEKLVVTEMLRSIQPAVDQIPRLRRHAAHRLIDVLWKELTSDCPNWSTVRARGTFLAKLLRLEGHSDKGEALERLLSTEGGAS